MGVKGWGALSREGPSELEPKDRRNQHVKREAEPSRGGQWWGKDPEAGKSLVWEMQKGWLCVWAQMAEELSRQGPECLLRVWDFVLNKRRNH